MSVPKFCTWKHKCTNLFTGSSWNMHRISTFQYQLRSYVYNHYLLFHKQKCGRILWLNLVPEVSLCVWWWLPVFLWRYHLLVLVDQDLKRLQIGVLRTFLALLILEKTTYLLITGKIISAEVYAIAKSMNLQTALA